MRRYRFCSADSWLHLCEKKNLSCFMVFKFSCVKTDSQAWNWSCVYMSNMWKETSFPKPISSIKNLCTIIVYILGSWWKRTSRIFQKSHSFILKWGGAVLCPLQARIHPTLLPFQAQSCWWRYDKSPKRRLSCFQSPGWGQKVLVLTLYDCSVSGFRGLFSLLLF